MKSGDQYLKIVEWSKEDQCYIGHCPNLVPGGVHGDDKAKVYKELCKVVEKWIAIYKQDGEPLPKPTAGKKYSGKFNLRVAKELHEQLSILKRRKSKFLLFKNATRLTNTSPRTSGSSATRKSIARLTQIVRLSTDRDNNFIIN